MTADQIRNLSYQQLPENTEHFTLLREIAAQLAEITGELKTLNQLIENEGTASKLGELNQLVRSHLKQRKGDQ